MGNPSNWGWSRGQFYGWGLGGAVGGLITGIMAAALFGLTSATGGFHGLLQSIAIGGTSGVVGGFIAGALGYAFSYWFDEPMMRSFNFRSSFLFGVVFTLLISSVLALLAMGRTDFKVPSANYQLAGIIFIATAVGAFVAAGIKGVLNNLKMESKQEDDFPKASYLGPESPETPTDKKFR